MQETGRKLQISTRAVSAWMRAGRLVPLPGTGGQGRPAWFDRMAVEALHSNRAGSEFLARVRYAFEQDRAGKWRSGPPWILWNMGPSVKDYLLDKRDKRSKPGLPDEIELVPLAAVPGAIKSWARLAVKVLSEKETRYLIALFVASEYPPALPGWKRYPEAAGANKELHGRIMRRCFNAWKWHLLRGLYPGPSRRPGDKEAEQQREKRHAARNKFLFYKYGKKWQTFKLKMPYEQRAALEQFWADKLFSVVRSEDYQHLKNIIMNFFPKDRRLLSLVIQYAKLENAQPKLKNALPSPPAVASVLGLSRMQTFRQWQAIKRKLPGQCRQTLDNIFAAKKIPAAEPYILECLQCGEAAHLVGSAVVCSSRSCGWQITIEELKEIATEENSKGRTEKKAKKVGSLDG